METVLNKNSTRKEVADYITRFNERFPFSSEDVTELLMNLASLGVNSYIFCAGAIRAANSIDKSLVYAVEKQLKDFDQKPVKTEEDYDLAFVAYYLLGRYYRTYEKLEKFSMAINNYQSLFEDKSDRYFLSYHIKARYLRRIGKYESSLSCDKKSLELLRNNNIDNIQVSVSMIATIAMGLEDKDSFITEKDITEAISIAKNAIVINSEYSRYRYLLAKLLIFSLVYKNDREELNDIDYEKQILEAKRLLREAIEIEDANTDSYSTNLIEYKSQIRVADLVLMEIRFTNSIRTMQKEQVESVQKAFEENNANNSFVLKKTIEEVERRIETESSNFQKNIIATKKEVDSELKQTQERYLEILGVFVSIVAVIMAVIGIYSAQLELTSIIIATLCMCIGIIGVYSAFLILLRDHIRIKYCVFFVFSIISEIVLICLLLGWSNILQLFITLF